MKLNDSQSKINPLMWMFKFLLSLIDGLYRIVNDRWGIGKLLAFFVISVSVILIVYAPFSVFPEAFWYLFDGAKKAYEHKATITLPIPSTFPRGWSPTLGHPLPITYRFPKHLKKGVIRVVDSFIVGVILYSSVKQLFRSELSESVPMLTKEENATRWKKTK